MLSVRQFIFAAEALTLTLVAWPRLALGCGPFVEGSVGMTADVVSGDLDPVVSYDVDRCRMRMVAVT